MFVLCQARLHAQHYYPGGVGKTSLLLWRNANRPSSVTYDGTNQVSQWADLSGNGYHFGQSVAGNKPVYSSTSGPNGKPALVFNAGNDQYLASLANLPATISFAGGISSFAMVSFNAPLTAQGWQRIYDFGNGASSDNLMFGRYEASQNIYGEGWTGSTGDQVYSTTDPITNGFSTTFDLVQSAATPGTLSTMQGWVYGIQQGLTGQSGTNTTWVPASVARTSNYIGRSNRAADEYFGGTMEEIILYNTAFSSTQRIIVENYLNQSWGQSAVNTKYTAPATNSYTTNLVGVGYTSPTDNFLANVAGSTDGLGFSSSSGASGFLNTAGYLMAAHNGQANTIVTNASLPGITSSGSLSRWNRSWNIQSTGGNASGQITVNFNFSDYNGTAPDATLVYALLYNATDGSFATGTNQLVATANTSVSGNIASFLVNASNLANGYYSLIYSASAITLPLTFTDFEAVRQGNASLLQWNVAAGLDPVRFDMERSEDGVTFAHIGSVSGVANGISSGAYSFTDSRPFVGMNWYRLKMTDQNGEFFYSDIRIIDFSAAAPSVSLYPNPTTDLVTINLNGQTGSVEVRVSAIGGGLIRKQLVTAPGVLTIPLKELASGVYVVEIVNGLNQYTRVVIKK